MAFLRLPSPWPSLCAVCHSWGRTAMCTRCRQDHHRPVPRCAQCALEVPAGVLRCGRCVQHPPAFDAAHTGVRYAHPWSTLIARFKFHDGLELMEPLLRPLLHTLEHNTAARPALLLPVPLSTARLRERGYNQAWEVTRRLARALRLPCDHRLLLRVADSPHQLDLPPEARAANVRGVFAVEPLRRTELVGRHVAVVDDVLTTGATLGEIARVLKLAGAARVDVWTLARTPRDAN